MSSNPNEIRVQVTPPVGVSKEMFRDVVAAAHLKYQMSSIKNGQKVLPTVEDVAALCRRKIDVVSKVMGSTEFRDALRERGVYWDSEYSGLSPEQVYTIGILTNPSDKRDMAGKLKSAGVSYHKYRAWLKDPQFKVAIQQIGEDMLGEHIQDVHTAVVKSAADGNVNAIRLYYELTGRFDPNKQKIEDLQKMVSLLLESIFRHVNDMTVLARINSDFDKIMTGKVPQAELIVDGVVVKENEPAELPMPNVQVDPAKDVEIPPGFFDFQEEK